MATVTDMARDITKLVQCWVKCGTGEAGYSGRMGRWRVERVACHPGNLMGPLLDNTTNQSLSSTPRGSILAMAVEETGTSTEVQSWVNYS